MKSEFWGIGYGNGWELGNLRKNLVISTDIARDLDRERMLRNTRFYITPAGRAYAAAIEQKYASVVKKDAYLAEVAKRNAEFPTEASHAAAAIAYNKRLQRELRSDD